MRSLAFILYPSGCIYRLCKRTRFQRHKARRRPVPAGMHQVKVTEVIQSSQYTYLKVAENGAEN